MDLQDQKALVEATNLSVEQYEEFLKQIEKIPSPRSPINGQQARLAFEFMEDTGLRVNEMIHIKRKDIDFRTRILTVTQPKTSKHCRCSRWRYKDEYTRIKVLDYADPNCKTCHGKGRFKSPQTTTITHRIMERLQTYCKDIMSDELLFPISRVSLWKWGKLAGVKADINIFQQKDVRFIEGIFPHLFRALCSLRMTRDSKNDQYSNQLVSRKLRHSVKIVTERYTKIDINYLLRWEQSTYDNRPQKLYHYKDPQTIDDKTVHWKKKRAETPTLCQACNQLINLGEIILSHHVSYFPEKIINVHSKCHREIHNKNSRFKNLQPNPFQIYRYYKKSGVRTGYIDNIYDISYYFKDFLNII